ncbi:MAG: ATP-binding protein [Candidatus Marinimicrobia bacterium]|jgi:hypothetical protein|nr:ATP-binding protein [Candidatus Neomarinimicrobiota bacterium]
MDTNLANVDQLREKWNPVLSHEDMPDIQDSYRKNVTAILLENQEQAIREQHLHEATPANQVGGGMSPNVGTENSNMQGFDPILISLVRRAMPNLIAYDVAGVQPMTGPTGLIFALKSKYATQGDGEALHLEARLKYGATGSAGVTSASAGGDPLFGDHGVSGSGGTLDYEVNGGMPTGYAEGLGQSGTLFNEMAFSVERTAVEAKTRALKAEYTTELAQDLKAVHGLDAETELANILSTEILSEINREVIRTIYYGAVLGAQHSDLSGKYGTTGGVTASSEVGGVYDCETDSDGRWSAERWRGLLYQLEREANMIAKTTRRGKGNFVICSADVASALAMSGFLQLSPGVNTSLAVDDTGNTFAGLLNGKMKVYIDPYSGPGITSTANNYACVGYRGSSPYDAGMFYCPYVPLQMVRAVGENTFQPKIGFKTRYGMVNNPFVDSSSADPLHAASLRRNQYYRIFRIDNLHGLGS